MTATTGLFPLILIAGVMSSTLLSPVVAQEPQAPGKTQSGQTYDPLEGLNRVTSGFNRVLRQWVIDPLVDGYQSVASEEVQQAVSNAASNLSEPITAASSLLQGDLDNAAIATKRFIVNSTAGIGGIMDPASEDGLKQRKEDVGQALGAHGVSPGPHIVLPVFGPSNLRDAVGDIATSIANPLPLAGKVAVGGAEYADKQDTVKAISDQAIDPYIAERDTYEQNRKFVINNGKRVEIPDIPAL